MAKQLGIRAMSDEIFYGTILKDGMTISNDAKDISQNNFMMVVLEWLEYKIQEHGNPIVIRNREGSEEWTISMTKGKISKE